MSLPTRLWARYRGLTFVTLALTLDAVLSEGKEARPHVEKRSHVSQPITWAGAKGGLVWLSQVGRYACSAFHSAQLSTLAWTMLCYAILSSSPPLLCYARCPNRELH
jgi:hypothetical protein